MPGLPLRSKKGPGPVEGDQPFMGSLYLASQARAYLENMAPSRTGKTVARRLSRDEVERRLGADIRAKGEPYLNELREQARRRPEDAHDILGTFRVASNCREMKRTRRKRTTTGSA